MISSLLHLVGLRPRVYYTLTNFRGGGGGKAPLAPPLNTPMVSSGLVDVDSGVPQGTVFGPILFLLHINDLPSIVSSKVRLFADDCLIYRQIKSNNDQIEQQRDLNLLESWGVKWGMRFNAAKCNIMRVSRIRLPFLYSYKLSGQVLDEVKDSKYLGVTRQALL